MTKEEFRILYNLPPEIKVMKTQARIREFYSALGGQVFLAFSGGKDSQVLAEIIRSMPEPYCDIELVFFDTHNEDKSIYEVVARYGATVISSPYTPKQTVELVGYPLFNKEEAHVMDALKRGVPYINTTKNRNTLKLIKKCRTTLRLFLDAPLQISDKCCLLNKKNPSKNFTKETGKHPILATLAVESYLRMQQYLKRGCNALEGKIQSTPIGFWKNSDILWYIAQKGLTIAGCYRAKITEHKLLGYKTCKLLGKQQTGCLYCGFGKGIDYAKKVLLSKCPEYVEAHRKEFDELH